MVYGSDPKCTIWVQTGIQTMPPEWKTRFPAKSVHSVETNGFRPAGNPISLDAACPIAACTEVPDELLRRAPYGAAGLQHKSALIFRESHKL